MALLLGLTGCSEANGPQPPSPMSQSDAAFVRLLAEAQGAMADGAMGDAARKLDEAQALAPGNPDLWVAVARLHYRNGEHLSALEAADRALQLGPDHAPALLLRALIVRDAHGFAAALPWFEAAVAADPDNADAWAEYAATLGDGGRGSDMLDAVRKLAEIAPADPRVPYLQAVLAARGGQPVLARSLLERSGMAKRDVPAAMVLDALISLEENNPDSAAAVLDALATRQPANTRVRELLARALFLSGRDPELVARFGADASLPEASPYLSMLVARAQERLGDRASAAPLLARAYAGASSDPVVLSQRAGLPSPATDMRRAAQDADWSRAVTRAQGLRARFPNSADIASLAGDAALGAGAPRGALEAYTLAAQVKRPWPLTRKAVFAYRQLDDAPAADTLLARHVAGEPNAITGLIELAQRQAALGEWTRAAMLLDHATMLGGGHDPALVALRSDAARALAKREEAERFAKLLSELRPRPLAP